MGAVAILAVVFSWGLAVEAVTFLVFGFHWASVALMLLATPAADRTRPWSQVVGMATFAGMVLWLGFTGMAPPDPGHSSRSCRWPGCSLVLVLRFVDR